MKAGKKKNEEQYGNKTMQNAFKFPAAEGAFERLKGLF